MRSIYYTLLVFSFGWATAAAAQKQLWGFAGQSGNGSDTFRFGCVWRSDMGSYQLEKVIAADTTSLGRFFGFASSGLVLASNGKIYGSAAGPSPTQNGLIFSFDPVTDSLRIAVAFATPQYPASFPLQWQLTEGIPGVLFGFTAPFPNSTIFRYYINNDSLALCVNLPNYTDGGGGTLPRFLNGPFFKATNSKLYSIYGGDKISWMNPSTNNFILSNYPEAGDIAQGRYPNTEFIEWNGKLYSTTQRGGPGGADSNNVDTTRGVIYSYELLTDNYTKLLDFDHQAQQPGSGMTDGANGLFYGVARGEDAWMNNRVIYSYDPSNNGLQLVQDLSDASYNDQ